MGYTNYWTPKKTESVDKTFFESAEKIINCAIQKKGIVLTDGDGETIIKSAKEAYDGNDICFNGYGEKAHEGFCLAFDGEWAFCKTARKPYDQVVKAILILAEEYGLLSEPFTFDGNKKESEYKAGKQLHDEALNIQRPKPTLPENEKAERKDLCHELIRMENKLFDLAHHTESKVCEKICFRLKDKIDKEIKKIYGTF